MTAEIAAWGVLCVAGVGAVITGLIIAGRWALGREKERTAAATFEADFIPECADVARRQADVDASAELDLVIAELDEALGGLRA
jgi:hypothetical protein